MTRCWLGVMALLISSACEVRSDDPHSAVQKHDAATQSPTDAGRASGSVDADVKVDSATAVATEAKSPHRSDASRSTSSSSSDATSPLSDQQMALQEDAGAEPDIENCALGPGQIETVASPDALTIEVMREPPLKAPFALAVSTTSGRPLNTTVQVCANGMPLATLQLYRGRGSATVALAKTGRFTIQARAPEAYGYRSVVVKSRAPQRLEEGRDLSGEGQLHEWTAASDVNINGVLRFDASETLVIGPGTRILLGANASIEVAGQLQVQGTSDDPVIFTRAGEQPWGGIRLLPGAQAWIESAWFVAGGADQNYAFGHSNSQPVIFVDAATLTMRGGGLIDNVGKAFGSRLASVDLEKVLISRCDTGGQFDSSRLHFRRLHVLEIPDADGIARDDDNDGMYFFDDPTPNDAGASAVVEDSVFVLGEDDAIDQNGASLSLHRIWIEGFLNEGIACSSTREVIVTDSVVRGCAQGIEAGYGAPQVRVERTLVTGNGVGIRFGDEYAVEANGSLDVTHSIVDGNTENLRNFVTLLDGPLEGALRVTCSVIGGEQYVDVAGNVPPPQTQPWPAESCTNDALLDVAQCMTVHAGPACL